MGTGFSIAVSLIPLIPGWYNAVARIAHWQTSARWEYDNSVNEEMYWQSLNVEERVPHLICLKLTSLKGWPWLGWHRHQLLHKSRCLIFTFPFSSLLFTQSKVQVVSFHFYFLLKHNLIWKECVFQYTRHSPFRGGNSKAKANITPSISGSTEEHCFTTEGIFDPLAGMTSYFKGFKPSSHHYW